MALTGATAVSLATSSGQGTTLSINSSSSILRVRRLLRSRPRSCCFMPKQTQFACLTQTECRVLNMFLKRSGIQDWHSINRGDDVTDKDIGVEGWRVVSNHTDGDALVCLKVLPFGVV